MKNKSLLPLEAPSRELHFIVFIFFSWLTTSKWQMCFCFLGQRVITGRLKHFQVMLMKEIAKLKKVRNTPTQRVLHPSKWYQRRESHQVQIHVWRQTKTTKSKKEREGRKLFTQVNTYFYISLLEIKPNWQQLSMGWVPSSMHLLGLNSSC